MLIIGPEPECKENRLPIESDDLARCQRKWRVLGEAAGRILHDFGTCKSKGSKEQDVDMTLAFEPPDVRAKLHAEADGAWPEKA